MGSLKSLHVPTWLSPFDLLRPLPGFRSLNVTGRYWGFLALPLSLLSAAALSRIVNEAWGEKRWRFWIGFAVVLQLGFQTQTLLSKWAPSPSYEHRDFEHAFKDGPQPIEYVTAHPKRQGELITPTRGVVDCYNEDDFIKADIDTGTQLVRQQIRDGAMIPVQPSTHAGFVTWSHIRLSLDDSSPALAASQLNGDTHLQLILNQAFHPLWQADGCKVDRSAGNNLSVDCSLARWRSGAVDVQFNDALSTQAAGLSIAAWRLWLASSACLLLLSWLVQRRNRSIAQA
jgi:hypothetical protein